MKNIILLLILSSVVTACGSARMKLPPAEGSQPIESVPPPTPADTRIDYIGLQQTLGLHRPDTKLGYFEKAFDTCTAGHGFSHSNDCHKEFFVLIHFQLKCRETEEAPADGSPMVVHPIGNHSIAWNLDKKQGSVQTDSDGFGQIRMSYRARPGGKHIKLMSDTHFLYVTASDLNQITTPPVWCQ
jgi:hypothetical protein